MSNAPMKPMTTRRMDAVSMGDAFRNARAFGDPRRIAERAPAPLSTPWTATTPTWTPPAPRTLDFSANAPGTPVAMSVLHHARPLPRALSSSPSPRRFADRDPPPRPRVAARRGGRHRELLLRELRLHARHR